MIQRQLQHQRFSKLSMTPSLSEQENYVQVCGRIAAMKLINDLHHRPSYVHT